MRKDLAVQASAKWVAGVVTFVIAVLGAVTGTLSYVRQQEVRLRLITGDYRPFERRGAVRIGIVNSSYRGLSIVGGKVLFNGRQFATIIRVLPDARILSDPAHSSSDVVAAAQEVPFAVAAGASLAGAAIWRVDDFARSEKLQRTISKVAHAKEQIVSLTVPPELSGLGKESKAAARSRARRLARERKIARSPLKLTLRLQFEPGGTKTLDVTTMLDRSLLGTADWNVALVLKKGRVQAMEVTKPDEIPTVATLRVWRAGSAAPARRITRPVVSSVISVYATTTSEGSARSGGTGRRAVARFPLQGLRAGRYEWAVTAGGTLRGAGTLITPCLRALLVHDSPTIRMTSGSDSADTCSPSEQRALRRIRREYG